MCGSKERERGYDEATMVESFVVLNAVGGECRDDFARLREDPGLSELIGHGTPSPAAARKFLNQFYDEAKIEEAKARRREDRIAYIPEENGPLEGLGLVNRALVRELGRRCPDQRVATVDRDASIIGSGKQFALRSYEGARGYQPMLAVWAEMDVVLADEFRDGNVPAMMDPLAVAKKSFAALPETVETYYYRGDSACHESGPINWLRNGERADGPRGFIGFAIGARMSGALLTAIGKVPEQAWETYGKEHAAAALHRDPHPAAAGEPVRRRRQGLAFRGADQHCGLEGEAADRVAPGEGGNDRRGTRRAEERTGGGSDAVEVLRSERGVAAAGGDHAQRDDGAEAAGAAGGDARGAAEAAAVPDLQHGGTAGAPRATVDLAIGDDGGAVGDNEDVADPGIAGA